MNLLAKSAAILAILIYVPTSYQVWRGQMKLNLATFLLWGALDAIAAGSMFVKGGNWSLPAAYVAGVALVIVAMLKARTFTWNKLETITSILVGVSIIVWLTAGPVMATLVSSCSMAIATIPQIWDTVRKPQECTLWVWFAYLIVNIMSTMAGKDWSVSERFYPTTCAVLTGIIFLLGLRKLFRDTRPNVNMADGWH